MQCSACVLIPWSHDINAKHNIIPPHLHLTSFVIVDLMQCMSALKKKKSINQLIIYLFICILFCVCVCVFWPKMKSNAPVSFLMFLLLLLLFQQIVTDRRPTQTIASMHKASRTATVTKHTPSCLQTVQCYSDSFSFLTLSYIEISCLFSTITW